MKDNKVLVIHGFNSSPNSLKAQLIKQYYLKHYPQIEVVCPQLKTTPVEAVNQLEKILNTYPSARWHIIGSSLGGYFATYLAEKYDLPAVLINPAVKPYLLLRDYLGEQTQPYTGETYQITEKHMTQLKSFEVEQLNAKQRFFVMVQTGDEVLDYRQAESKYRNFKMLVEQGGDHSFIDFESKLSVITEFFQF